MRRNSIAVRVLLLALAATPAANSAFAKEPTKSAVDDLLAQAERAADEPEKAAPLYGKAVTAGQTLKILALEEKATDALEAWFRKTEPDPTDPARAARPKARDLLALVMAELDPKRNGAYVSAHVLASQLLADAVALGDGAHVEQAAAVLSAHASTPKSGAVAAALAQWADGMLAVKKNDAAKAEKLLESAAKAFAAGGWLAHAASASTELAALRWTSKNDAKTAEALGIAASIVSKDSDPAVVREWTRLVKARLMEAPPAALEPFTRATAPFEGPLSAVSAGGAGGKGGNAGGVDVSDLGKVWPQLTEKTPVVTVTREKATLRIKPAYPRKDPPSPVTLPKGQQPWEDGGGVTLFLTGPAVALAQIDLKGTRGQPGGSSAVSRVRAFYLLADGETWSLSSRGTVTVSK